MPSQSPSILHLHHAQITIPPGAEAQARAFYCDLLGLHEIEKPDSLKGRGGFWVMVGDQQLHIGVEDGVNRSQTKAHLAYQVADLASWHTYLLANGVVIGDSIPIPGHARFEFRDPFGNRVEFICPLDEETNANTKMGERRS
jgi:catechol 2,3-dioxygenase-like lactoylglutathione lyase family enzyme